MKKTTLLPIAALLLAGLAVAPAGALGLLHFGLRTSQPAADSSVPAPAELVLTFTQVPQENSVSVRLIDAGGDAVDTGDAVYDDEDRRTMHVAVEGSLAAGTYTVAWRGIGDDGHVVRGDFGFTVTADR